MESLRALAEEITHKRKALGLTQTELARQARISRATLDALENGRLGEIGFAKISNLLAALGLTLRLEDATLRRPTLDELLKETGDDQNLDQRR